jgi:hypothetical protein
VERGRSSACVSWRGDGEVGAIPAKGAEAWDSLLIFFLWYRPSAVTGLAFSYLRFLYRCLHI